MTHYTNLVQTFYCDGRRPDGGICISSFEEVGTAKDVWKQATEDGWKRHSSGHICNGHKSHDSEVEQ